MRITINFSQYDKFATEFRQDDSFCLNFGEIGSCRPAEPYEGPYVIVPKVNEQLFNTNGKLMQEDLEVTAIPKYETTNPKGGYTCYIASEL